MVEAVKKPEMEGEKDKRPWYKPNTYYQILEVSPAAEDKDKREEQKISTTVVTKKRGGNSINTGDNSTNTNDDPEYFYEYLLDQYTISKLEEYPRKGDDDKLSSYLPSSGVVFSEGFIETLSGSSSEKIKQTEVNNFYSSIRTLLYSRKMSQLIAKTWWCYLEAKKRCLLDSFASGDWDSIIEKYDDGIYILDGLIAREIFLFAGGSHPDKIEGGTEVYMNKAAYEAVIILPTSKSWQGICLSLLLAGQAYYKIGNKYHQISQPILSTGEIVANYSLEVDWNKFDGDLKEIVISQEKPWIAYEAVIPYPPIPEELDQPNLKKWADAEDDSGSLPFYNIKDDKYLIDVKYFRSPYPYIPLTCS